MSYARPSSEVPVPVSIHNVLDQALAFCEHVIAEHSANVQRAFASGGLPRRRRPCARGKGAKKRRRPGRFHCRGGWSADPTRFPSRGLADGQRHTPFCQNCAPALEMPKPPRSSWSAHQRPGESLFVGAIHNG